MAGEVSKVLPLLKPLFVYMTKCQRETLEKVLEFLSSNENIGVHFWCSKGYNGLPYAVLRKSLTEFIEKNTNTTLTEFIAEMEGSYE